MTYTRFGLPAKEASQPIVGWFNQNTREETGSSNGTWAMFQLGIGRLKSGSFRVAASVFLVTCDTSEFVEFTHLEPLMTMKSPWYLCVINP